VLEDAVDPSAVETRVVEWRGGGVGDLERQSLDPAVPSPGRLDHRPATVDAHDRTPRRHELRQCRGVVAQATADIGRGMTVTRWRAACRLHPRGIGPTGQMPGRWGAFDPLASPLHMALSERGG
jgi:hypothetical protein